MAVINSISTFDTVLWGYATLLKNIGISIILLVGTILTFYVYYLFAYLVFFLYLIILEKTKKLSLIVVMISGFLYGLIPVLFDHRSLDSILISLFIGISGALCAACYYYLHENLDGQI